MIKMVALDLDGTLLNSDQTISKQTIDQLVLLHKSGRVVGIVTGRTLEGTHRALRSNGIFPISGFPHVLVVNERDIYQLRDGGYAPIVEWNQPAWEREATHLELGNRIAEQLINKVDFPIRLNDPEVQERRGFVQLRFENDQDSIQAESILFELLEGQPLRPVRNTYLIDLRGDRVGKGIALKEVAKYLELASESILAVGDSQNDICMLREFVPATTDNADPEVKNVVADKQGVISPYITSDGVAHILQQVS